MSAFLACPDCNFYVENTPEGTLAHLIACEAGDTRLDRNTAIKRIRTALRKRSGKDWSVRGDHGTAWGWIHICAPPRRMKSYAMSEEDLAELSQLLNGYRVHQQGVSVPASTEYYAEYVALAEGREPTMHGKQYWD